MEAELQEAWWETVGLRCFPGEQGSKAVGGCDGIPQASVLRGVGTDLMAIGPGLGRARDSWAMVAK